jgi:hypothetical protein
MCQSIICISVRTGEPYVQNIRLSIAEEYTKEIVLAALARRSWCSIACVEQEELSSPLRTLQLADFESIDWNRVLAGEHRASCYCIRKGMSRKAQLSLYLKKYTTKACVANMLGAIMPCLTIR